MINQIQIQSGHVFVTVTEIETQEFTTNQQNKSSSTKLRYYDRNTIYGF